MSSILPCEIIEKGRSPVPIQCTSEQRAKRINISEMGLIYAARIKREARLKSAIENKVPPFRHGEASIDKSHTRFTFLIVQSKYTGLMVLLREVLQLVLRLDHPILPLHMPPPFKDVAADSICNLRWGKYLPLYYLHHRAICLRQFFL